MKRSRWLGTACVFWVILIFRSPAGAAESDARFAVYRSEDHGRSWTRADAGLPPTARVNAFAAAGDFLVAGTDQGAFGSMNQGREWRPLNLPGSPRPRVTSLASTGEVVFAGTPTGSLLTSTNGTNTWRELRKFPSLRTLYAKNGLLYLGTAEGQVHRSADSGQTWTELSAGLPTNAQVSAITSVNGHIFAGYYSQGLYRWNEEKGERIGTSSAIQPLVLAASAGVLIAGHNPGGIYLSKDSGETWQRWKVASDLGNLIPFEAGESIDAPIWAVEATASLAIAGAGDGIFLSDDNGAHWTRAGGGLPTVSPGIAFLIQNDLILSAIYQKKVN